MFSGLFSPMHLIVVLIIVLIIFGPGKLPELGNSLGKSIKNFKKAMEEPDDKLENTPPIKKIDTDGEAAKIASDTKKNDDPK